MSILLVQLNNLSLQLAFANNSSAGNTGKTTFLNFLKALFVDNITINRNQDFRSNFNAEWANKLIIGVDETLLYRKENFERIKSYYSLKIYKFNTGSNNPQI